MAIPGAEQLRQIVDIPGIPDSVVLASPLRFCAFYILDLMDLCSDEVVEDRSRNNQLQGKLDIECSSPFSGNLGLCLNNEVYELDPSIVGAPSRIDMAMTIGETTTADEITSRFIQLRRSNGELFGVTGLSKEISRGRFEQWHAVTMRMITMDDHMYVDLWATTFADSCSVSSLLVEQSAGNFNSYQVSMQKALSRTARRVTTPASSN